MKIYSLKLLQRCINEIELEELEGILSRVSFYLQNPTTLSAEKLCEVILFNINNSKSEFERNSSV